MPNTTADGPRFGVAYIGNDPVSSQVQRARFLERSGVIAKIWLLDQRFLRDVWVQLTSCAVATQRIELGPCVTDPYIRHPALTAAAIATLDEVSGGRSVLGLGAGASGFAALGIAQVKPATALREAVTLIRELLRADHAVDFTGAVVRFHGDWLRFPRRRDIPIYVAGRGPRVLAVAAQFADAVIIGNFVSGRGLEYCLEAIDRGAARRDPALGRLKRVAWVAFSVDVSGEAARAAVRRPVAVALMTSHSVLREIGLSVPRDLVDQFGRDATALYLGSGPALADIIPDDLMDSLSIAGTPDECIGRLRALRWLGIDEFAIYPFAVAGKTVDDTVSLLISEVIPGVAA